MWARFVRNSRVLSVIVVGVSLALLSLNGFGKSDLFDRHSSAKFLGLILLVFYFRTTIFLQLEWFATNGTFREGFFWAVHLALLFLIIFWQLWFHLWLLRYQLSFCMIVRVLLLYFTVQCGIKLTQQFFFFEWLTWHTINRFKLKLCRINYIHRYYM